jgi:multiple sugar transport system permease protein
MKLLSMRTSRRGSGLDTTIGWRILSWIVIALLLLFTVVPLAWMLSTSIKSQVAAMQQTPRWIPEVVTWDSYLKILDPRQEGGQRFLRYFWNSLVVSIATTLLSISVTIPAAYAFSRFRFHGRNALLLVILMRNMFPAVIFLIPLFLVMRTAGLVDRHASLIVTYMTFGLPLSIWLLKGYYDNIPRDLEEAAQVDGATQFGAFLRVTLPLSAPGIVAAAIYIFLQAWNEYLYALTFLNSDRRLTLPVGLQAYFSEFITDWPGLMASSFIMSIPVVILFLILQRFFVQALTEGALKS